MCYFLGVWQIFFGAVIYLLGIFLKLRGKKEGGVFWIPRMNEQLKWKLNNFATGFSIFLLKVKSSLPYFSPNFPHPHHI